MNVFLLLLLGVWGFGVVLYYDVIDDIKKWRKAIEVLHRTESYIRAVHMVMPIGAFWLLAVLAGTDWKTAIVTMLMLLTSWYWILFDGIYNVLRGQDWWFPGSPNGKQDDSFFDRMLRKLSGRKQIAIVKIGYVLISTSLYIWTK